MSSIDQVAIRFNPIHPALAGARLAGLSPVVSFIDQGGMAMPAGQLESQVLEPTQNFQLARLTFAIDMSKSMDWNAIPGSSESKIDFLKREILQVSDEIVPAGTPISLIVFCRNSQVLTLDSDCDINVFKQQVQELETRGGTNFSRPLADYLQIVQADRVRLGKHTRQMLVFITDGIDKVDQSLRDPIDLAAELRDNNVASYLLGLGITYRPERIEELAQSFAFAGHAHLPATGGASSPLKSLIPEFIIDMQASDQYLQVEAVGGFTDFVAAHFNPLHRSFKPAVDNKVFAGFTQHGRALLFQNRKDISIYFNCGAAANELLRSTEPIEIIHEDDAASYYDQLVEGRKIIDDYLVFDAQTQRDLARIKALHEHFKRKYNDPFLQAAIDEFENNPDLEDPMEQSQAQLNTRGMSGTHQTLHDQTNLRELLQHYKKLDESSRSNSEPDPYQIPPSDVFGHSGNLGALDHSITWDREIPMPSNPDPRVYDYMVPKYAPTAVISFRGDTMKLDLSKKTSFSIGRKNSCEIRLVADTVSRQHCRIFQEKDVFWIEDLTSRNGTLVNGLKLQPGTPKQLRSDDIVTVADYSISFRNLD